MNGKQRVALAGFQLALGGMLSCGSDANTPILPGGSSGAPPTGAAGAPVVSAAGADSSGAGTVGVAGSGGSATGTGGAPPAGGSPSTGGSGGAGGGSAGGAAAGAPTICTPSKGQFDCNNILGDMDGYASQDVPFGPAQPPDAIEPAPCTPNDNNPKIWKEKHWQLKGLDAAKMYKVALHFYGVVECKTYSLLPNATGPAKSDNPAHSATLMHNLWMPSAVEPVAHDHWNTYAFTNTPTSNSEFKNIGAQDMAPSVANSYVINQCPGNDVEDHYTFAIDFDSSIVAAGGSWINYIEYDSNCRMIMNCGGESALGTKCAGPYNVVSDVTSAVPNTNATFTQPPINSDGARGQWWLVDVTNITAM